MNIRLAGMAILATLGVIAVLATTGFGDGSGRGPDAAPLNLTAHRVSAPSGGVAKGVAARGVHRAKLIYKETPPKPLGLGGHVVKVGQCPRRSAVVNGYYLPDDFGVISEGNGPTPNVRKWEFDLFNGSTGGRQVIFGVICVKP
jgi:hypothetical protein